MTNSAKITQWNYNDTLCQRLNRLIVSLRLSQNPQTIQSIKGEIRGVHQSLTESLRRNSPTPNWEWHPYARDFFTQNDNWNSIPS